MIDKRLNILVILLFAVLTGLSIHFARSITFDFSFDVFFPKDDPDREFYNAFSAHFEPDDNYILVGIENEGGIFDSTFLQKVDSFTKAAADLPYILRSTSLTNLKKPLLFSGSAISVPVVNLEKPEQWKNDSSKIVSDPRLLGRFVAPDGEALAVVLTTDSILHLRQSQELSVALDNLLYSFDFEETHIAGRPHYQTLLAEKSETEFTTYTIVAILLIVIILSVVFRKWVPVVVALISVLVSMILFLGFLGVTGVVLDPMSILFPILIMIVGISDVIHIMSKYISDLEAGWERHVALKKAVKEIGLATFLTSATTAIGFASLATAAVPAIRNFGVFAAVGVFIAFFTVILLTTSILALIDAKYITRKVSLKNFWKRVMAWFFLITHRKRKVIGALALVFLTVCLLGISLIPSDAHFENNFPRGDQVQTDYRFFEEEFGGVRNYEVGVMAKGGHRIVEPGLLQQIDTLEQFLAQQTGLHSVVSPATIYKTLHRGALGDRQEGYRLPKDTSDIHRYTRLATQFAADDMEVLLSEDFTKGRISARMNDMGMNYTSRLNDRLEDFATTHLDTTQLDIRITGAAFLMDKSIRYGREYLFYGLGLAFVIISIIMAFLFRDVKMILISLIPNVFPLIIAGAVIGFAGIEMTGSTTVVFAIAFGIAVDDTIHFLSKLNLELRRGKELSSALRSTFMVTGKALCLTTMILFFGFITLVTSGYPATFYIGFVLSITLLFALLADLFLIPVCLYAFYGKKKRQNAHGR